MDWSKAKNILILIFAFLNVFLFVSTKAFHEKVGVDGEEAVSTAALILSNNGVVLECDIPSYNKDTGIPEYEVSVLNRSKIVKTLMGVEYSTSNFFSAGKEPLRKDSAELTFNGSGGFVYKNLVPTESVDVKDIEGAKEYLKSLLGSMDLSMNGFVLDEASSRINGDGVGQLIYIKKYKDYYLYDSIIKMVIGTKGLTYLEYCDKNVKSIGEPMKIISAYQILLKNYNQEGVVITSIDYGFKNYKPEPGAEGIDTFVWRIGTKGGKIEYYKAYTGESIGNLAQ